MEDAGVWGVLSSLWKSSSKAWRDSHALGGHCDATVPPVTSPMDVREPCLQPLPCMHRHGQHSLPHKPQKISSHPVTPTRNRGWVLWIPGDAAALPSATSAVSPDRWHCHTSPPQLRATSPAPWESPCALPVRILLCPWETQLAHIPL